MRRAAVWANGMSSHGRPLIVLHLLLAIGRFVRPHNRIIYYLSIWFCSRICGPSLYSVHAQTRSISHPPIIVHLKGYLFDSVAYFTDHPFDSVWLALASTTTRDDVLPLIRSSACFLASRILLTLATVLWWNLRSMFFAACASPAFGLSVSARIFSILASLSNLRAFSFLKGFDLFLKSPDLCLHPRKLIGWRTTLMGHRPALFHRFLMRFVGHLFAAMAGKRLTNNQLKSLENFRFL
jgi:hypothetical protein